MWVCQNSAMTLSDNTLGTLATIRSQLEQWARELGFQQVGITGVDLAQHEGYLQKWLDAGYQGDMHYMTRHGLTRARPAELIPGTCTVLTLRMDYFPGSAADPEVLLTQSDRAYISRYALGRDYHKLMRQRLARLAKRIEAELGSGQYRAFVDSAPVLERALAEQSGMGWIAKNTMLINEGAGSWFFLGEIYTDIPFTTDAPKTVKHCGSCTACLDVCPTQAFVAPHVLDARKCISYLTIEHSGSIDPALRPLMGNRIYGCDDCQLVCPWNKFSQPTSEPDFAPRHNLDNETLSRLFAWTPDEFEMRMQGSPIRRIGYERWLRNIAIALGNANTSNEVIDALNKRRDHPSALVREHVAWALDQHGDQA
jgi:epoxyqueuosine reductase